MGNDNKEVTFTGQKKYVECDKVREGVKWMTVTENGERRGDQGGRVGGRSGP